MIHKFFTLCFLIPICYLAKSQTVSIPKKVENPKTFTLKIQSARKITNGYLSGINDSLIQLSTKRVTFSNSILENPSYKTYNYSDIENVNIRKYGSVGKGILYGALIGAGVGGLVGLASYHREADSWFDLGPGFSAAVGAIIGAIPGIIIGTIRGSQMRKFSIRRNKEKFKRMKTSILEMSLNNSRYVAKDSSVNK